MVKEEPDPAKQDIDWISKVKKQAILYKREWIPHSTRPGTEKGYYVYVEDEGGVYIKMVDEKGVPTLVLDMETDRQLVTDYITEQDTEKYFVQQKEQEDGDEMETLSSTSTADYDQDEVEASLTTITDAFHKIGNEYEHLCSIVSRPRWLILLADSPSFPLWVKVHQLNQRQKQNPENLSLQQP